VLKVEGVSPTRPDETYYRKMAVSPDAYTDVSSFVNRSRSWTIMVHQKGYIDFWLKFIGVKEVLTLVVEGTT
jgi:hypothetical protein